MHIITKKQKKEIATYNSMCHMHGMYDYKSVDGRTYQTEKYSGPLKSRRSRILSPEEKKEKADKLVSKTGIVQAEKFLGQSDKGVTPWGDIYSVYGYDEETQKWDSDYVFTVLKKMFPAAQYYTSWIDIFFCIKSRHPLRTEPIRVVKPAGESVRLPSDVPMRYKVGDHVWIIVWSLTEQEDEKEREDVPLYTEILSYYTRKMSTGVYDIMYELAGHGHYGQHWKHGELVDKSAWRLQKTGVFNTREEAEAEIKRRQKS